MSNFSTHIEEEDSILSMEMLEQSRFVTSAQGELTVDKMVAPSLLSVSLDHIHKCFRKFRD